MPISKSLVTSLNSPRNGNLVKSYLQGVSYIEESLRYFEAIDQFSPVFESDKRAIFNEQTVALKTAGLLTNIVELCFYGLQDLNASAVNFSNPLESITWAEDGDPLVAGVGGITFPGTVGTHAVSNYTTNLLTTTYPYETVIGVYGAYNEISMGYNDALTRARCYMLGSNSGIVSFALTSFGIDHLNGVTPKPNGLHISSRASDAAGRRSYASTFNSSGEINATNDFATISPVPTRRNIPLLVGATNYSTNVPIFQKAGLYGGHLLCRGPLTQSQITEIAQRVYIMMVAAGATSY